MGRGAWVRVTAVQRGRERAKESERECMCVCLCVCLLEQMGAYSLDIFFMTRTVCEAQKSLFRCDAKSIFNLFMW